MSSAVLMAMFMNGLWWFGTCSDALIETLPGAV